jgi:hypothetical protein
LNKPIQILAFAIALAAVFCSRPPVNTSAVAQRHYQVRGIVRSINFADTRPDRGARGYSGLHAGYDNAVQLPL